MATVQHADTHREIVEGLTVANLVEYLPLTDMQKVIECALSNAHTLPAVTVSVVVETDQHTTFRAFTDPEIYSWWLGAPVTISSEGYGDATWKGHVEEIPDAVTSRRLKPQDPARPSDTRVLLVKVALDGPIPVKLGQRVEVEVQTDRAPQP